MGGPPDGSKYERRLENRLWSEGWASFRTAGSGTVGHDSADVTAVKNGITVIFDVKGVKPSTMPIDVSETSEQLIELNKRAGRDTAWFAVYVKGGNEWRVYPAETTMISMDTEFLYPYQILNI